MSFSTDNPGLEGILRALQGNLMGLVGSLVFILIVVMVINAFIRRSENTSDLASGDAQQARGDPQRPRADEQGAGALGAEAGDDQRQRGLLVHRGGGAGDHGDLVWDRYQLGQRQH